MIEKTRISFPWAILLICLALILWPILAVLEIIVWFGGVADSTLRWMDRSWVADTVAAVKGRIYSKAKP